MGQSFFAISIGISIMVTYSSYLNKKESLPKSAITIVGLNLFVSLFAGLAIFPAVFSLGMEPTEGPGLLFIVLPSVFSQIPFGGFFLNSIPCTIYILRHLTSAFFFTRDSCFSISKWGTRKENEIIMDDRFRHFLSRYTISVIIWNME